MHIKNYDNLFFIFLFLLISSSQTTKSHDFSMSIPAAAHAGMGATIGCGGLPYEALAKYGGAALGSSFGPVGTIAGVIIGGLIGFLVNKCARKTDHKYDGLSLNDAAGDHKTPTKTVEDIIGESRPIGKTKGPSKQYEKQGSYEDALKDFESLAPQGVQNIEKNNRGKWGNLADGRRVVVRLESSGRVPTLEIQIPGEVNKIKIRYVNP